MSGAEMLLVGLRGGVTSIFQNVLNNCIAELAKPKIVGYNLASLGA